MPKLNILIYTATVIEADFDSDQISREAVTAVINNGIAQIEPQKLNWVVAKVSDKPIDIDMGDSYREEDVIHDEEQPRSSIILPP